MIQALRSDGAGLVINERLLNCPPQLASPLHHSLFDEEIPWAMEDEPTEELRDSFNFKAYLFLSRVYRDGPEDSHCGTARDIGAQPKKRQKVKGAGVDRPCRICCAAVQAPFDRANMRPRNVQCVAFM